MVLKTHLIKVAVFILMVIHLPVQAQWYEKNFHVMGTEARVQFWHQNKEAAASLVEAVIAEMQRIDQSMSPYISTSELSRINQQAHTQPVTISDELFDLIGQAQDIAKLSGGAFDITYASIGYQYDYRNKYKPDQHEINKALPAINYQSLVLNPETKSIFFQLKYTRIDLGGIAKGHAVKRCLAILQRAGVQHALVSAGGDTGLLGDRKGRPWMVGIKHPRAEQKSAVHLPLTNEAISTSGDYERYFIEDGVRYHHIINPKTGHSAKDVVSVSVIGSDPTIVDALSTTLFVLGLKAAMALIDTMPDYEAIIIDNQQTLHFSKGLSTP